MPNDGDWLDRPVLRDVCKFESLYDGTLRIEYLAKASDLLAAQEENQARMRETLVKKK